MHFALTSEQELARNALRELLAEHCTAAHLRRVFEADEPLRVPGLWSKLHELGVIGALAPEAVGGLGLNAIDLTVLLEETGRAGVPELVVESAAVAVPLLAALSDDPRAAQALKQIVAGELSVTLALGAAATATAALGRRNPAGADRHHGVSIRSAPTNGGPNEPGARAAQDSGGSVHEADSSDSISAASRAVARGAPQGENALHRAGFAAARSLDDGAPLSDRSYERQALAPAAALAGLMLCEHRGDVHLLDARQVDLAPVESVDRARRLYAVSLDASTSAATRLAEGPLAQQLLAAAQDHAALGTAAQLVGLGHRMLDLTINHVKTRKQFGQAIGVFQAVKHQLVDARLALEFAAPLVYRAAHSIAHEDPERSLHVSMAKAFASEAALLAARKALQLHGAIGYSYEYELQLYMKRAWALAAAHGDALAHRTRIADVMLGASGAQHG